MSQSQADTPTELVMVSNDIGQVLVLNPGVWAAPASTIVLYATADALMVATQDGQVLGAMDPRCASSMAAAREVILGHMQGANIVQSPPVQVLWSLRGASGTKGG